MDSDTYEMEGMESWISGIRKQYHSRRLGGMTMGGMDE